MDTSSDCDAEKRHRKNIFGKHAPDRTLPLPQGIQITAAEFVIFFPNALRSHEPVNRLAQAHITNKAMFWLLTKHRYFKKPLKKNALLHTITAAMRDGNAHRLEHERIQQESKEKKLKFLETDLGLGFVDEKTNNVDDREKKDPGASITEGQSRDRKPNKGNQSTVGQGQVDGRPLKKVKWTFSRQLDPARADDFVDPKYDQNNLTFDGVHVLNENPHLDIPLKSLLEDVKELPHGKDASIFTKCVRLAGANPELDIKLHRDLPTLIKYLGGRPPISPDHLDHVAFKRWNESLQAVQVPITRPGNSCFTDAGGEFNPINDYSDTAGTAGRKSSLQTMLTEEDRIEPISLPTDDDGVTIPLSAFFYPVVSMNKVASRTQAPRTRRRNLSLSSGASVRVTKSISSLLSSVIPANVQKFDDSRIIDKTSNVNGNHYGSQDDIGKYVAHTGNVRNDTRNKDPGPDTATIDENMHLHGEADNLLDVAGHPRACNSAFYDDDGLPSSVIQDDLLR